MIEWFLNNKEWFFSGLGISIVVLIFTIVKSFMRKKKEEKFFGVNVAKNDSVAVTGEFKGDINIGAKNKFSNHS